MEEKKEKTECCLHPERVFVFGSNEAGWHGGGAASHALRFHGAVLGKGKGMTGGLVKEGENTGLQVASYAIPTMDANLEPLPLEKIGEYVKDFIVDVEKFYPHLQFFVTAIGCGIAGFKNEEIAPLFDGVPLNCMMPLEWEGLYKYSDK